MVGGTFDYLHAGHVSLLAAAFEKAGKDGEVIIGLSSDAFASRKSHVVLPFETRRRELESWIAEQHFSIPYTLEILNDPFGSALEIDFDILIVSYDTAKTGELINEKRIAAGKKPVVLHRIQCVFAHDGKPVSSSRICRGEINRFGDPVLREQ